MKVLSKLFALSAFVLAGFCAQAQFSHLEQSIFMNVNLPTAEFNNRVSPVSIPMYKDNMGKEATVGFGLGYRISYRFDVGFGEVSPYFHADFQWNQLRSEYRDAFTQASSSTPNYFNVPLYIGVNYRYQLTEVFTPFGEVGFGPDFLFVTKEGNTSAYPSIRYKMSTALAWQLGAGCFFGPRVSASLHYSGYGKHVMAYTKGTIDKLNDAGLPNNTNVVQRNIGVLSLRVGFHF